MKNDYLIAELSAKRHILQNEIKKAYQPMMEKQQEYYALRRTYLKLVQKYQQTDLKYAELTKFTNCNEKKKVVRKKSTDIQKLTKQLSSLPKDKLDEVLKKFEANMK